MRWAEHARSRVTAFEFVTPARGRPFTSSSWSPGGERCQVTGERCHRGSERCHVNGRIVERDVIGGQIGEFTEHQ